MSRLNRVCPALLITAGLIRPAFAFDRFACLRDLMPATETGAGGLRRQDFGPPFAAGKYIVFPELSGRTVMGFYVYGPASAHHYDSVEIQGKRQKIVDLAFSRDRGVLDLTAQPEGLETVSVPYLPGYGDGPGYRNPDAASEWQLRAWMIERSGARVPADERPSFKVERTVVKMLASNRREDEIRRPLSMELSLRQEWVKGNNLAEPAFKQLSRAMETSCKP